MSHSWGDLLFLIWRIFLGFLEAFYRLFRSLPRKCVKDKIILITGAARGIGRELAYKFTELGARLVLWDINQEGCDETATEIQNRGGFAKSYTCDVTNKAQVHAAAQQVMGDVGDVYMLINNAGITSVDDILHQKENTIRNIMNVNVISHFWTVQEFLPKMLENNDGHIVSMASMAGKSGVAMVAPYSASKHAVIGFAESLSEEVSRSNKPDVHTSIVCPMFIYTNMIWDYEIPELRVNPGPDGILKLEDAVSEMVDGLLRNKEIIYVPSSIGRLFHLTQLFPLRVLRLIKEYMDIGWYYNEETKMT